MYVVFNYTTKMMTDLNVLRQNMIEHMIKFLADDCYIYIVATGLDKYKEMIDNNDFYTFQMRLCSEFHTRIECLYADMGFKEPSNQANKMYAKIVSDTVIRIQSENLPFSVGLKVKPGIGFEIVILKKKIEHLVVSVV